MTDNPNEQPNDATPAPDDANPGGQQGDQGARTFTPEQQAEMDRIVGERAVRAKQSAIGDLLKELGVEDVGALKRQLDAQREAEEAEKTELEKAQERLAEMERQQRESDAATRDRLIRAEIRMQAAQMGFRNADIAYAAADLSAVDIGEDGEVSGVKDALESLAKAEPYLVGEPKPPAPGTDGGKGSPPQSGGVALTPQQEQFIRDAEQRGFKVDRNAVAARVKETRVNRR